ncbi:hypothetical protein [Chryseobacterium aurantiacum]|uniref:hypothetical protein n=1 Tax=Chryseobacterium aurantiacum TaxID=2116499 RepID=UPI000D13B8EA|nr:hypothetical protein [Chryseobacterium aurantiacum]
MEEIRILSETISELLDNGYLLQNELTESFALINNIKAKDSEIPALGFKVDKIYKCYDDNSEVIYVFAISNANNNVKGIATSIDIAQNTIEFSELFKKIRNGIKEICNLCFWNKK